MLIVINNTIYIKGEHITILINQIGHLEYALHLNQYGISIQVSQLLWLMYMYCYWLVYWNIKTDFFVIVILQHTGVNMCLTRFLLLWQSKCFACQTLNLLNKIYFDPINLLQSMEFYFSFRQYRWLTVWILTGPPVMTSSLIWIQTVRLFCIKLSEVLSWPR